MRKIILAIVSLALLMSHARADGIGTVTEVTKEGFTLKTQKGDEVPMVFANHLLNGEPDPRGAHSRKCIA